MRLIHGVEEKSNYKRHNAKNNKKGCKVQNAKCKMQSGKYEMEVVVCLFVCFNKADLILLGHTACVMNEFPSPSFLLSSATGSSTSETPSFPSIYQLVRFAFNLGKDELN